MALTRVKNNSGEGLPIPARYGGTMLLWGSTIYIGDTFDNVRNAFGGPAATAGKLEFASVPDGSQPNVISQVLERFISAEQTGTGGVQSIAHGLGVVPARVLVSPSDTSPATVGLFTATEGTHDATNVIVTVTSGKKYKVLAFP